MPRKTQSQSTKKSSNEREPDDRKEGERATAVGRRGDEYEDVEASRSKSSHDASDDTDEVELSDDDIFDEVDLDAQAEGDGPDA